MPVPTAPAASTAAALAKYLPFVTALVAFSFPGAAAVAVDVGNLLADLTADKADADKAGAVAGDLKALLTDAFGSSSPVVQTAETELGVFSAFVSNVRNNQVGVIQGDSSMFNVPGIFAFIPRASPQGQSLGL